MSLTSANPESPAPLEYQSPAVREQVLRAGVMRGFTLAALVAIFAVALVTRFAYIDRLSLHYDEAWNLTLSTGRGSPHGDLEAGRIYSGLPKFTSLKDAPPWWRIPGTLQRVTHPPLYSIALRFWRAMTGDGDVAGRAFSAVLSALAVLLLFDAVRTLHESRAAGLWAALIMALAGPQIELAQEIRPYAQLVLLSCGALAAIVRVEKLGPSKLRLIALGVCVLGMMLTQYFAIGPCLALGAYAVLRLRGTARRQVLATFTIAAIVFLLAWGRLLWNQRSEFANAAEGWLQEDPNGHVVRTLERLAALPLRLLYEPQASTYPAAYGAVVLLIAPIVLTLSRKRPELLLWTLWLLGTAGFLALIDLLNTTRHLYFVRYIMFAGPAMYAIIPVLLPRSWTLLRNAMGFAAAAACALALGAVYSTARPDARPLGKFLDVEVAPGEIVVFNRSSDAFWYGRVLFLQAMHYSSQPERPFMILEKPPAPEQSRALSEAPGVWLITGTDSLRPSDLFPGAHSAMQTLFPYVCGVDHVVPPPAQPGAATTQPTSPAPPGARAP